jgi:hypothetical protein
LRVRDFASLVVGGGTDFALLVVGGGTDFALLVVGGGTDFASLVVGGEYGTWVRHLVLWIGCGGLGGGAGSGADVRGGPRAREGRRDGAWNLG